MESSSSQTFSPLSREWISPLISLEARDPSYTPPSEQWRWEFPSQAQLPDPTWNKTPLRQDEYVQRVADSDAFLQSTGSRRQRISNHSSPRIISCLTYTLYTVKKLRNPTWITLSWSYVSLQLKFWHSNPFEHLCSCAASKRGDSACSGRSDSLRWGSTHPLKRGGEEWVDSPRVCWSSLYPGLLHSRGRVQQTVHQHEEAHV